MPVTIEDAPALARTLPRSTEAVVPDQVKLRVGRLVYAELRESVVDASRMCVSAKVAALCEG